MLIRDDIFYVGLNQLVGGYSPDPSRAKVDVLLINTITDEPIKMITESTSGMSMPTKPEADEDSMLIDENNDIYINCISGWGYIGHKSGFLRIKSGETEFDNSYVFDVTNTILTGEQYSPSYLIDIKYIGNGILYATANINEYYSATPNYFEDRTVVSVEINLQSKIMKKLPLLMNSNYGTAVGYYYNSMLFGLQQTKILAFTRTI